MMASSAAQFAGSPSRGPTVVVSSPERQQPSGTECTLIARGRRLFARAHNSEFTAPRRRLLRASLTGWLQQVLRSRHFSRVDQVLELHAVESLAATFTSPSAALARSSQPRAEGYLPPTAAALAAWLKERCQRHDEALVQAYLRAWKSAADRLGVDFLDREEALRSARRRKRLQRAIGRWQLRSSEQAFLGAALRRAMRAVVQRVLRSGLQGLRGACRASRAERQRRVAAQRHCRLVRLRSCICKLRRAVGGRAKRLQRRARNEAAAKDARSAALLRKSFLVLCHGPLLGRAAIRLLFRALWRAWCRYQTALRTAEAAALEEALQALSWRGSSGPQLRLALAGWLAYAIKAQGCAVQAAALQVESEERLSWRLLRGSWELWIQWPQVLKQAQAFGLSRGWRSCKRLLQAWAALAVRRRHASRAAAAVAEAERRRMRRHVLQRWHEWGVLHSLRLAVKFRERQHLLSCAVAALWQHRETQQLLESWRQRAANWRYRLCLRKGIAGFRLVLQRKTIRLERVPAAKAQHRRYLLRVCSRTWRNEAQPAVRLRARKHAEASLLRRALAGFAEYRLLSRQARRAREDVRDVVLRASLRMALRRLNAFAVSAVAQRRSLRHAVSSCHLRRMVLSSKRALMQWSTVFVPLRRRGRGRLKLAAQCRERTLQKTAVSSFGAWLLRAQAATLEAKRLHRRVAQGELRRSLQLWTGALVERQRMQKLRDAALLQWYAVLSNSAFRQWATWCQARRRKKKRQAEAQALHEKAQEVAAVRMVLACFDLRRSAEEAAAAANLARRQRQAAERCVVAAQHWQAAARRRAAGLPALQRQESLRAGVVHKEKAAVEDDEGGALWQHQGILEASPAASTSVPVHAGWSPEDPLDSVLLSQQSLLDSLPSFAAGAAADSPELWWSPPEPLRSSWTPSLSETWANSGHSGRSLPRRLVLCADQAA
eukprot:TRINITY_DN32819_c0_g1_i1.p1 TRINITY_DN32819_c0_g1~~TRINITY_DN32819_c0_g1_i1.p1  ORF type:complete len:945 (+),score=187.44 TRINITY_DN32819_c0_g1_i1:111-2945(+)